MSKQTKHTLPLFLFLLGVTAFNLSTLPSGKGHFQVTSLSSEFASDCDSMGQSINRGANSASCVINPVTSSGDMGKVSGRVEVTLVDVPHRDPKNFDKVVTRKEWQRTTEITCDGKDCPRDSIKITKNYDQDDYNKLGRMDDFESGAQKMIRLMKVAKAEAEKERAEQDKRYRCEVDRDGHKLNERDQMRCRVARLDKITDEEAAADYYEQYLLPNIERMVGSNDVRQQRAGMDLLRQLNRGENGDFVKESIGDLARFGQYKYQSDQQKLQIMAMNPNDPNRAALVQQMRMSQFQADMYFRSRGLNIQNDNWGIGNNGFDYTQTLLDNLNGFRNRIDQNYASVLQQYQGMFQNPATMQPQVMNQQQQFQPNTPWPAPPPQSPQQMQQMQQVQNPQFQQSAANQPLPTTQLQAQKSTATINRTVGKR